MLRRPVGNIKNQGFSFEEFSLESRLKLISFENAALGIAAEILPFRPLRKGRLQRKARPFLV